MKRSILGKLMLIAVLLTSVNVFAYNFQVDGIYYNVTSASDLTVGVTYSYNDEYLGQVTIPETVTYNSTTYSVTSIGEYAFSDCTGLTSVTIGNNVTSIGKGAFDGCTGLTNITIPEGVTSIGNRAFYDCSGLTSVTIGNNVTSIGEYAFQGCTGLTNITIPEGVTSIGTRAFYDCSGLTSVIFNATNCTTMGSAGLPVFTNCTNLTNITIGDNVKIIPSYAFWDCTSLTSITIPNSVINIGCATFDNCTSLKELRFEDGKSTLSIGYNKYIASGTGQGLFYECPLETLYLGRNIKYTDYGSYYTSYPQRYGYSAFYNKTTLKSVTIGKSVTSIGNYTFNNCTSLEELRFEDGESTLSLGYNGTEKGLFYDCPLDTLYLGRSLSYKTDSNYGYSPFFNKSTLKSATIGNSVTSIGYATFAYCTDLTNITIGKSVASIGDLVFYGCSRLESFIVDSENTIYDSRDNCNAIIETATNTLIQGCKNSTIPNSVTSIGTSAFRKCSGLTSVTIPESVTNIGAAAFGECEDLTRVNISDLEAWCKIDFSDYGANPIYYAENLYLNGELLTNIEIPKSITQIKNYSFTSCRSLTSVTIPEGVTSIGDAAFENCKGLTSLVFNAENCTKMGGSENSALDGCTNLASITIGNNVKIIPHYAFRGCSGLTNIIIPNSVTSIGDYAFYKCSRLKSIIIPDSVTSIATSTFGECKDLTSVIIPESVTSIDNRAFEYCRSLTSITIPNSVTSIGKYAFYKCTNLTELTLGSSVKRISEGGFAGASRLETIYSLNPTPPTCDDEDVFDNVNKDICKVYVPTGSGVYYQTSLAWRDFDNIEEMGTLGVESTLTDDYINVAIKNGNIVINRANNTNVEVYSTNGKCVYNGTATTIPINTNGLYIVKVNGKSFKVIL